MQDETFLGTAPWAALIKTDNGVDVNKGSADPAKRGARFHFEACIVCQRLGESSSTSSSSSVTNTLSQPVEGPGPLLLCSTCPASFHLSCLRPRLRVMPEGPAAEMWSCAYCYATGRAVGGDSDGACGAVRLMESLRQAKHNAVRVRTTMFIVIFLETVHGKIENY